MSQHKQLDPSQAASLRWHYDSTAAHGAAVLDVLRPGLTLQVGSERVQVPRAVWHDYVFDLGKRLMQTYVGFSQVREHEGQWLLAGLMVVQLGAKPPSPALTEELYEVYPGGVLGLLATLGTLSRLHMDRPAPMTSISEWIQNAVSWAGKRHLRHRRCAVDPATLSHHAMQIHAEVAEHRCEDVEAAVKTERDTQLTSLITLWRDHCP